MDSPKGAALHVLPAESHVDAIFEKGTKGHVLSQSPVHLSILHQVWSTAQDARHTWTRRRSEKTKSFLEDHRRGMQRHTGVVCSIANNI